ncbi:hypothetical protein SGLAM104S_03510 [Streptomyces glaucescens]
MPTAFHGAGLPGTGGSLCSGPNQAVRVENRAACPGADARTAVWPQSRQAAHRRSRPPQSSRRRPAQCRPARRSPPRHSPARCRRGPPNGGLPLGARDRRGSSPSAVSHEATEPAAQRPRNPAAKRPGAPGACARPAGCGRSTTRGVRIPAPAPAPAGRRHRCRRRRTGAPLTVVLRVRSRRERIRPGPPPARPRRFAFPRERVRTAFDPLDQTARPFRAAVGRVHRHVHDLADVPELFGALRQVVLGDRGPPLLEPRDPRAARRPRPAAGRR